MMSATGPAYGVDTVCGPHQWPTSVAHIGGRHQGGEVMATKGSAILLVYTDLIDDKYDEELNAWYDTQHLPQLLALPGVLDAARYVAVKGGPKYLAAYEVENTDTVLGPAWQNRPIPAWDNRMSPRFIGKNFTRVLGEQIFPDKLEQP